MEVKFSIKSWKIQKDEKAGTSKIIGSYELLANGKVIANQNFNGDYGSIEVPFSGDLIQKLKALENDIIAEIQKIIE